MWRTWRIAARGLSVFVLTAVLLPATRAQMDVAAQDVLASLRANLGGIRDFSFEERVLVRGFVNRASATEVTRHIRVTLLGEPHWQQYAYRLTDQRMGTRGGDPVFNAGWFDGQRYWSVQGDGMGVCLEELGVLPYMSYAGIYLSKVGLGPAGADGRLRWEELLLNPRITLEPSADGHGKIILKDGDTWRELDPRFNYMPVRFEEGPPGDRTMILISEYRQFDGRWFPTRLERKGSAAFISQVSNIRVNQGLTPADLEVPIPYGTSLSFANDVVQTYGTAAEAEAEAGLRNWLAYGEVLDRAPPNVRSPGAALVLQQRRLPLWAWLTSLAAAFAIVGWSLAGSRRRARQRAASAAAAVAICALAPPARGDEPPAAAGTPAASAARCAYITLAAYGHNPVLRELLADVSKPDVHLQLVLVDSLSRRGVFARSARLSLDELSSWPHPVIVRLQPGRGVDHPHYAIVTGVRDGRVTLINPNCYGALLPMPAADFQKAWDGSAVLTSPVPIVTRYGLTAWASGALPIAVAIPIALLARRARWRAARRVGPLFVLLVCASLCGCSDEPTAAPSSSGAGRVSISPGTWNLGDTYPGQARQRFTIENPQARPLTVQNVSASCGCMASGLPVGVTIPAHGVHEFELTIDLSAQRGAITQQLTVGFSDGSSQQIRLTARVKRGVYTEPAELRLSAEYPLEEACGSVQLMADDEKPFEIISATASLASRVNIDKDSKTVAVAFLHENRTELIRDTLRVRTSHPYAAEVRVPIVATFALTWELDPPILFLEATEEGAQVQAALRVRSRTGQLFAVPARDGDPAIIPRRAEPQAEHEVLLRLTAPVLRTGNKRVVVDVPTTLADAETIPVTVVFIRRPT